jgi:uncharacterized protein YkwD
MGSHVDTKPSTWAGYYDLIILVGFDTPKEQLPPVPPPRVRHEDPFHILNLVDDYGLDLAKEMFEREVFRLTNVERANHGLPALIWDDRLAQAAREHSKDISLNAMVSHIGSDGSSAGDRVRRVFGHNVHVSENVTTVGFSSGAVRAWMDSDGHRRNLLDAWTHIGIGVYFSICDRGTLVLPRVTQKFAKLS